MGRRLLSSCLQSSSRVRARLLPLLVVAVLLAYLRPWSHAALLDFGAFYCGARTVAAGSDPSRVEPLRACEASLAHGAGATGGVAVPAPLPLPALALLAPLARLPFLAANALWLALLLAAGVASLAALERLVPALSPALVRALVLVPLWAVPLELGQPSMLAVAALAWAALAVRAGRDRSAAAFVLIAAIQPQLAVGALGSLVLVRPRARLVAALGLGAAAGAWLALAGPARMAAYVAVTLPAQARAEYGAYTQYAPTFALAALGVPAGIGLALGMLATLAGIVGGIMLGRRIAERTADRAFLVAVPAASAVIATAYVHAHQLAAALPAALLLAQRTRGSGARRFAPLVLLAVPWLVAARHPALYAPLVALAGFALARAFELPARSAVTCGAAAVALVALATLGPTAGLGHGDVLPPALPGAASAQASWAAYLQAADPAPNPWALALKLPTWLGLALLVRQALDVAELPAALGRRSRSTRTHDDRTTVHANVARSQR